MANVQNPFGEGMSDFNLIDAVDSDVLGSPNKVSQLQAQLAGLQAALSGPQPVRPSENDFVGNAIQGVLAGLQGGDVMVNPLTGAETAAPPEQGGFSQAFLAGLGASIEGNKQEALAKYQEEVKQREAALAQREKLASGIRMVLAQNPLALAPLAETDEGKLLLGQLAYGLPIPLDPGAKQREADESLQRKQRMQYLLQVIRSGGSPAMVAQATNDLQDMVDPDSKMTVTPADMVRGKIPSYSEVGRLYGDPGLKALAQYRLDGDVSGLMTKLGGLKMVDIEKDTTTSIKTRIDLAQKIAAIKRDAKSIGKEITDVDAVKQLPDEDRVLAENLFRNITGGKSSELPLNRYIATFERAWDDQPSDIRMSNPEQAMQDARNLAMWRLRAAKTQQQRDVEAQRKLVTTPPAAAAADGAAWSKAIRARAIKNKTTATEANKALVSEYLGQGKADQIPAWARKNAGM